MSSTPPPARRRLGSVVTVRRAQSERRYLSPWQASSAVHAKFWQPIVYPPQAVPSSSFPHPMSPKTGWGRMERIDHRLDHHHHAPRTALIPPALPRSNHPHMIGRSQMVLSGDLWGSMRHPPPLPVPTPTHVPYMSPVQLPPLALGSPPPLMAMPPLIIPPSNLQDRLAKDRLTAFLAGESTYRPRSILSCPESPLYESLVSTFSALDDELTFPDTDVDHEYQQIPVLDSVPRKSPNNHESTKDSTTTPSSPSKTQPVSNHESTQTEHQTPNVVKICTLDVRPEKNSSREKDLEMVTESPVCNCQSGRSSDLANGGGGGGGAGAGAGAGVSSPPPRKIDGSSQTVSPSTEFNNRSSIYITNKENSSPAETTSSLSSDSDTYQYLDRPPTVIYLPSSTKGASVTRANSFYKSEENHTSSGGIKQNSSFPSQDKRGASPRVTPNVSTGSSNSNSKPNYAVKSNHYNDLPKAQKKSNSKTPEATYLPLTIELPETKVNPRKAELSNARNSSTQMPPSNEPHIITTLDPPIKTNNLTDWTSSNDIPPLVVNFDSEHSESEDEDDLRMETDSSSATLDDSSSLYVTESDATSIYSSVAELYSVIPADPDALVYVYKAVPHRPNNNNSKGVGHHAAIDYRIPAYILNRNADCRSVSSSCGSETSSSSTSCWSGDTVSFVEPTYRPSNLSVGSRGTLKIDYSWSWNNLDNFVRTTSPRGRGSGSSSAEDRVTSPGRSKIYSHQSPQQRSTEDRISSRGPYPLPGAASPPFIANVGISLSPWEKYSDPVAG